MARVMMYKRFERLWHWSQAFLIIAMMVTGLEVHGTYDLFGFEKAVDLHVTQLVDYTLGIHAMIPKEYFVGDQYRSKNGLLISPQS